MPATSRAYREAETSSATNLVSIRQGPRRIRQLGGRMTEIQAAVSADQPQTIETSKALPSSESGGLQS
jgi:hypothetical protein